MPKPLRIFCSYSHEDEAHLDELRTSLRGLERQGLIEWWHDREIVPGWEWEEAIDKNLRTAEIILLLVTPDFMCSDYVFEKEIDRAIERQERGEARVIPVIVRPADWEWAPFGKLQALPKDAKPITTWMNQDEAWLDVVRGIRKAVAKLTHKPSDETGDVQGGVLSLRYREGVELAWADGEVDERELGWLRDLVNRIGLSPSIAASIEREVMGETIETILELQERATREEERHLDELYAQARRLHQDRKWQAVVDKFEQIHAEEPAYPDPAGLLEAAREALESERVAAEEYDLRQRQLTRQEPVPPETVEIPDLSGQEVFQASETLTNKGLELGAQNRVANGAIPEGKIIRQSPEAGMEVEAGSLVSITVSSGSQRQPLLPALAGPWWMTASRGLVLVILGSTVLVDAVLMRFGVQLAFGLYKFGGLLIMADGLFALIGAIGSSHRRLPLLVQGVISGLAGLLTWSIADPNAQLNPASFPMGFWAVFIGIICILATVRLDRETRSLWLMGTSGVLLIVFGILMVWPKNFGWWLTAPWVLASGITMMIFAFRARAPG